MFRPENALVKTRELQDAIFRNVNFSYIATDENGVIRIFNAGAERMLGYAAAEAVDKITPAAFSDPQELAMRAAALSVEFGAPVAPGFETLAFRAAHGAEDTFETTKVRKDGSRFPAILSVTALHGDDGGIIGYLLIGTDNSARKTAERELRESNIEREKERAAAEKANLAKSDFLSGMSHELRSPLHTILGFAQLIDGDDPPPTLRQAASVEQILKAGWYLLELISEILDLAQIESGKLAISSEPTSLTEVMRECRAMIVPQGRKRKVRVTFPDTGAPYFVDADRTRLKQVLINLLSNAIKYNHPDGSVVVDCALSNGAGRPKRVRVSIADTGAGLSPEMLLQLFQPFNRLGKERTDEEGTGIGLAMSKRLVEMMGGVIGVESTVGSGSVFWFELNSAAEPQSVVDAADLTPRLTVVSKGAPTVTMLYVEDNPANLELVKKLLESRRPDILVLGAGTGTEGVRMARESHPDVILMDINLPGMTGVEAFKLLAADPTTAPIPVIALSANAMPRDIKKGLDGGFFRYLTKPIKVRALLETLEEALEFGLVDMVR
jgi:signal transduction histidine kinase/CheY-like chemotaxis protein